MKTDPQLRIVEAERLRDGVIISFEDRKSAVFSASLLYATLPQAYEIVSTPEGGPSTRRA
jgi:hypothetical protein